MGGTPSLTRQYTAHFKRDREAARCVVPRNVSCAEWARPPFPAPSSALELWLPRPAVRDAFVPLKSAQAFIVRSREGNSIFFSIKGNAVISNLTARSFLLIGLYFLRANLPSPL